MRNTYTSTGRRVDCVNPVYWPLGRVHANLGPTLLRISVIVVHRRMYFSPFSFSRKGSGVSIAPKTLRLLTRCGLFRRLTDGRDGRRTMPMRLSVEERKREIGRRQVGRWAEAATAAAAATAASLTVRALAAWATTAETAVAARRRLHSVSPSGYLTAG